MAFAVRQATEELHFIKLTWRPDRLLAEVAGEHLEVERQAGQGVAAVLVELERQLNEAGWMWLACDNCLWYWTTGASLSQGQGGLGYCAIVGVRRRQAIVHADHACGRWTSLASPHHDPAKIRAEREDALRIGRPDRRSEVVGCSVGLGAAAELYRQSPVQSIPTDEFAAMESALLAEFQRVAECVPPGLEANPSAAVDAFVRTLVAEHRHWALLDAALILGVAGWRQPFDTLWSLLGNLANAAEVEPRLAANCGLLARWTQLAMAKRSLTEMYAAAVELIQGSCHSAHDDWAPWLGDIHSSQHVPPSEPPSVTRSDAVDDLAAVPAAWFAWQRAGTLLQPACQFAVHMGGPLAELLAGALSGTMNGQNHVLSQIEPAIAERLHEWTRVGEELWGQMSATARGDRPR